MAQNSKIEWTDATWNGKWEETYSVGDADGCFIRDEFQKEIPYNPGGRPYYAGRFPEKYPDLIPIKLMKRIDKKHSGRLLDGREWNEMPEVK